MKQASEAAVHSQVFSEVRGKDAACDDDMNTVYLSGVWVHADFPLRPLGEPGLRLSGGLRARQARLRLCCGISSAQLFGQTHAIKSIKVSNLHSIKKKRTTQSIVTFNQTSDSQSLGVSLCCSSAFKLFEVQRDLKIFSWV